MLEQEGLTLKDVNAVPLTIPDGLSAFRRGDLDAWATYGYAIQQAQKDGAKWETTDMFQSLIGILSNCNMSKKPEWDFCD